MGEGEVARVEGAVGCEVATEREEKVAQQGEQVYAAREECIARAGE